jgi:hypothetical protein
VGVEHVDAASRRGRWPSSEEAGVGTGVAERQCVAIDAHRQNHDRDDRLLGEPTIARTLLRPWCSLEQVR